MFAVSLHLCASYEQCPRICVVLTKNLEVQHPSFQCTEAVRMLRFCLHAFLILVIVLPAWPVIFYELRVCVNWLCPLFCLYVVRTGVHVHVWWPFLCYPLFGPHFVLVRVLQVHCAASIVLLRPCAALALPNIQGDLMLSILCIISSSCAVFLYVSVLCV